MIVPQGMLPPKNNSSNRSIGGDANSRGGPVNRRTSQLTSAFTEQKHMNDGKGAKTRQRQSAVALGRRMSGDGGLVLMFLTNTISFLVAAL